MELVWGGDRESASTCLLSKRRGKQSSECFKEIQEDKRVVEVMTNLKFFGGVGEMGSCDAARSALHSLLAYQTDNQLKFRLLATEDQLPTPSRLCMWAWGMSGVLYACHTASTRKHRCCIFCVAVNMQ